MNCVSLKRFLMGIGRTEGGIIAVNMFLAAEPDRVLIHVEVWQLHVHTKVAHRHLAVVAKVHPEVVEV